MLMLWKTDFFTAFDFCKADRSVGFGGIWSQVALLHHQQNCLLSWLYMNTLFTSANSPKVMGLHQAKVWKKWCLPGVLSICKEAKNERSRIYGESECNFSESFRGKRGFLLSLLSCREKWHPGFEVLSPDRWVACWRKSIEMLSVLFISTGKHSWKNLSHKKRKSQNMTNESWLW